MRQSIICSFCLNLFESPSAVCPSCGGPVAEAGAGTGTQAVANDDAIELDDSDLGELILVPVGSDDALPVRPPAQPGKQRPPPLPGKRIARA